MTVKAPRASSIPDLYYGKYVSSLFSDGEQGVWYDPSDLSTLFQDAAGTTPVTAVEQPVGLMLDKSKNGVGRNGTKKVNLLRNTERFSDSSWVKQNSVVTENATNAPDGEATADLYVVNASSSAIYNDLYQQFTGLAPNLRYVYRVCVKSAGRRYLQVILNATSFVSDAYVNVDLVTGAFTHIGEGISDYSIVPVENGFFEVKISGNSKPTVTTQFIEHVIIPSPTSILYAPSTSNGTDGIYIWGADLRLASEANTQPLYQRVDADWPSTIPGNHATQTTTASRPVLSAKVNILRTTTITSSWVQTNVTVFGSQVGFNNSDTAIALYETTTNARHGIDQPGLNVLIGNSGITYKVRVKSLGSTWCVISFGGHGPVNYPDIGCFVNLTTGQIGNRLASSVHVATVNALGDGWWEVIINSSIAGQYSLYASVKCAASSFNSSYIGNPSNGILIDTPELRLNDEFGNLPPYQRVNTATDYETQGFPYYLRFDGVDDSLVTPSIDFTSTDKMTVFAGVRKLSDSMTAGILVELSANADVSSGTFAMTANDAGRLAYVAYSKGTEPWRYAISPLSYYAPDSRVLRLTSDIAEGVVSLGVDGVRVAKRTLPQGADNYGNYPIFIGRRGGTTFPFNGRLYGLIVRGAQTDDLHLTNIERYLANKSGVVL